MKNTKIDELQKQLEETTNNWKRALADYQNLEKRTQEEKIDFAQFANTQLILKLLPALDTFAKLEEHLKDEHLPAGRQDVSLAVKQLSTIIYSEGLEKIEVLGKEFNPQEMECVETAEGEENKVIKEVGAGYSLKGKVIRVAQVVVGKKVN